LLIVIYGCYGNGYGPILAKFEVLDMKDDEYGVIIYQNAKIGGKWPFSGFSIFVNKNWYL
jgi:hypothetical protein